MPSFFEGATNGNSSGFGAELEDGLEDELAEGLDPGFSDSPCFPDSPGFADSLVINENVKCYLSLPG